MTTTRKMTIDHPVEFPGTPEEARANYRTHDFHDDGDGDIRCWVCDTRPSGVAASYRCGAHVPRTVSEVEIPV